MWAYCEQKPVERRLLQTFKRRPCVTGCEWQQMNSVKNWFCEKLILWKIALVSWSSNYRVLWGYVWIQVQRPTSLLFWCSKPCFCSYSIKPVFTYWIAEFWILFLCYPFELHTSTVYSLVQPRHGSKLQYASWTTPFMYSATQPRTLSVTILLPKWSFN